MDVDLNALNIAALVIAGLAAGFINAIAGAGSLLTVPALLLVGLPGSVANATNRVGVFAQSVAGGAGYARHGKLDYRALGPMAIPLTAGAGLGAWFATLLSDTAITAILLATMFVVGLLYALKPDLVAPPEESIALRISQTPIAIVFFFLAGIYGGFVQSGVGFVLLAILGGVLRYDIVRANALKIAVISIYTALALAIFALSGLVAWVPGLVLAAGTVVGALFGVRFGIARGRGVLRWIVLAMIVVVIVQQSIEFVRA